MKHAWAAWLLLCLALLGWPARAAPALQPLQLPLAHGKADAWAHAQLLFELPGQPLSLEQVRARADDFAAPTGPKANLGMRTGGVWLRLALQVPVGEAGTRLFEIDHPPLDHVEMFLLDQGQVLAQSHQGDAVPFSQRPLAQRSHGLLLPLVPGQVHELYVRVHSSSSLLLPMTLYTPRAFLEHETRYQMLQGVFTGLGLCLLLYSLAQWLTRRDRTFLYYAAALLGVTGFFFTLYGFSAQHLWGDNAWLTHRAPILFALLGLGASCLFVNRALEITRASRTASAFMRGIGVLTLCLMVPHAADWLPYEVTHLLSTLLGVLPMVLAVPMAMQRARQGDGAARYMIVGWTIYGAGVVCMSLLLRGLIDATPFTLHAFQVASMFEMGMWMLVLGARWNDVQRAALQAEADRQRMEFLAHADPLTGLLNRRGLLTQAQAHTLKATPGLPTAVFMLDLDGFKQVNDDHGHAVGDALLQTVATRLLDHLRAGDVVARLGGDEFVVVASRLQGEAQARQIARKLQQEVTRPLVAAGVPCTVGVTIGYALSPADGQVLEALMQAADAAMYTGKRTAKGGVQRCAGSTPVPAAQVADALA